MPLDSLRPLAETVLATCRRNHLTLATAESCTGGLIAGCLTAVAGSSDVVDRGFVTYSNAAKTEMLGIPAALIEKNGAVSEPTARAMAEGAVARSGAAIAVAVTGIAGPGGGTAEKPVGLVHLAVAHDGFDTRHVRAVFAGDRDAVRAQTVRTALEMILEMAGDPA